MCNHPAGAHLLNLPTESIRVRLPVIQFHGGPHLGETRLFDYSLSRESHFPLREISHRRERAPMRRKFTLPDASDVDDLSVADGVSGGAMADDRPLIDDGS